jgi:hypothetical protein
MKKLIVAINNLINRIRLNILWHNIAAVYGWNELARQQDVLGARLYCRMKSFAAEKLINESGLAVIPRSDENPITITIDSGWRCPEIQFRESDWELMRDALARHDANEDAKKAVGK